MEVGYLAMHIGRVVEDMKEFCGDMGGLMRNIMIDSETSFYNEHRLLKINEAQREYIDGNISREEMDSRIEIANQTYRDMLEKQIQGMKNEMMETEISRKILSDYDKKRLEEYEKKGFWSRWKTSKQ